MDDNWTHVSCIKYIRFALGDDSIDIRILNAYNDSPGSLRDDVFRFLSFLDVKHSMKMKRCDLAYIYIFTECSRPVNKLNADTVMKYISQWRKTQTKG